MAWAGAAGAVALAALVGSAGAAHAASWSAVVGDSAEAWYSSGPVNACTSAVGCPPIAPPATGSYPVNTLHVVATVGEETARTYVLPDLSAIPADETAVTGTMTLPLATVSGNGNSDDSAATIEACLAEAPFTDGTENSTDQPPPVDCTVHAEVAVGTTAFTLNITPFLTAWNSGSPQYGIALIPDLTGATPVTNWHVAFNGKGLTGAPHITSTLYSAAASAPVVGSGSGGLAVGAPAASPTASNSTPAASPSADLGVGPKFIAVPAVVVPAVGPGSSNSVPAPETAKTAAGAPTVTPAAGQPAALPGAANAGLVAHKGFQYPEVLLLPLAFAVAILFAVRLLTSDATPRKEAA